MRDGLCLRWFYHEHAFASIPATRIARRVVGVFREEGHANALMDGGVHRPEQLA